MNVLVTTMIKLCYFASKPSGYSVLCAKPCASVCLMTGKHMGPMNAIYIVCKFISVIISEKGAI